MNGGKWERGFRGQRGRIAQVSFSMVAVLILVLSSGSVVLICQYNNQGVQHPPSVQTIKEMNAAGDAAGLDFEQLA